MELYNICLCMGRFQPFHWGHFDLVQAALAQGEQVIILLGSHLSVPSIKNPWSSEEREKMIRMCISPTEQARIQMLPIYDYETNEQWASIIHREVYTIACLSDRIAIAGHHDDGRKFFSQWFPDWNYVEKIRRPNLNATDIRIAYFGEAPETHYRDKLPPGTLQYLRKFKTQPNYRQFCQEFHARSRHNRDRGKPHDLPLPHHPACGSAPGGSQPNC
ncbi:MAG: adenylyltransferase/cytidyltransferase family protein [Alkalinema sp. RU_4_3]|nr:adenylyltransferase/cytidyltransferase family protein [Alkalinema sp. RU_4_3]